VQGHLQLGAAREEQRARYEGQRIAMESAHLQQEREQDTIEAVNAAAREAKAGMV